MKSPVFLSEFERPKLQPLAILTPLEEKVHTATHLKALISG